MNTIMGLSDPSRIIASVCSAPGCAEIATVLVEGEVGEQAPLCGPHWQAARKRPEHPPKVLTVLPRPECFVATCREPAVEIVVHLDGALLPCREPHIKDLSWVTPESSGDESDDA
jgi:hypothetical protein